MCSCYYLTIFALLRACDSSTAVARVFWGFQDYFVIPVLSHFYKIKYVAPAKIAAIGKVRIQEKIILEMTFESPLPVTRPTPPRHQTNPKN